MEVAEIVVGNVIDKKKIKNINKRDIIYITVLLSVFLMSMLYFQHITNKVQNELDEEYRYIIYDLHNLMNKEWKNSEVSMLQFVKLVSELNALGAFTSYSKHEVSLDKYTRTLGLYVENCILNSGMCKDMSKNILSEIFLELYEDPLDEAAINKLLLFVS